jgi:hypothetical protein
VATLLAYIVWQLAETALERSLGAGTATTPGVAPNARARTLRPLLRKFILGVLVVVWAMIALSAVGIDIGPLLAGAGVVGIALGFGAQTLVRDVVSGIFFLIDDAFRVGEYIEAGSLKGTVEGISIRSLRVRHHRGALHTISLWRAHVADQSQPRLGDRQAGVPGHLRHRRRPDEGDHQADRQGHDGGSGTRAEPDRAAEIPRHPISLPSMA